MEAAGRAWGAVAVWLAAMATVTSVPGSMVPDLPSVLPVPIDRPVHFGTYAMLGVLVARALRDRGAGRLVAAWAVIALVGGLDEWHQRLLPGRDAELVDWLMDITGAACGLALGTLLLRTRMARWLA